MKKIFIIISFTLVIATFYIASAIEHKESSTGSSETHRHEDHHEADSHQDHEKEVSSHAR